MRTWSDAVKKMANFYASNVHTYQGTVSKPRTGRKAYNCSLLSRNVYDDCSGFTSACLLLFGAFPSSFAPTSGVFANISSAAAANLRKAGFKPLTFNKANLLPFDIVAMNGHVEIYAGKSGSSMKSYSWGNIHDNSKGGMPSAYCNDPYKIIWRHDGVTFDNSIEYTATNNDWQSLMNQGYTSTYGNNNYGGNVDTFTGTGGSVFSMADENTISFAYMNKPTENVISNEHTRIYSTNNATIVLDELSIPLTNNTEQQEN